MKRLGLAMVVTLAACGSTPPPPDWQANTKNASDRAVVAWLNGEDRIEAAEFARARAEAARTGRADLVARVELLRCAARVASLGIGPCSGFEPLRADAPPAEQAYADYLAGQPLHAARTALLPVAQQGTAREAADPLARLVALGVRFQRGQADPADIAAAIETASAQGWRRPLLAWLGVELRRAEAAGATEDAARIRRRMDLVASETSTTAGNPPAR